jgi:prepilin-type N-terminal cleavage/methylation domain-containing protein
MKLPEPFSCLPRQDRAHAGFTLPEALIATALFSMLVLGIVSVNLFGLRWYQIGQNKMVITDAAREAVGRLSGELRNCNNAFVGNVSNGTFVAHVDGEAQTGNGLMIYTTTNTNSYVLYYVNTTNQSFNRFTTDLGTNVVIANSVTNGNVFQVQDYLGNVQTNNQNSRVIHCTLQFFSALNQDPAVAIYQVQTAVAPRSQN